MKPFRVCFSCYLFAVFFVGFSCNFGSNSHDQPLKKLSDAERRKLQDVLANIYDQDQEYRAQAMSAINQFGLRSKQVIVIAKKIEGIDSQNIAVVKSILKKYGWLGSKEVGEKASSAFYLVIQHASKNDRAFFLPIMKRAAHKNLARMQDLAHLEDRVALDQGRKQIYGTQLGLNESTKKYYLFPLKNPQTVDQRRSKMELIPIREFLSEWQIVYQDCLN
jgi:hypothetical protein